MRYVKLNEDQKLKLNSREVGITSGPRNKETGKRENVYFCSSLVFSMAFGNETEKEFIEI